MIKGSTGFLNTRAVSLSGAIMFAILLMPMSGLIAAPLPNMPGRQRPLWLALPWLPL
jgi:hypothetical protein